MSEMVMPDQSSGANADDKRKNMLLFWGCFAALIATAFGFQVRAMLMETWGTEFGIDKTQQGEIFGAGLWPFAISIIHSHHTIHFPSVHIAICVSQKGDYISRK